jgi:hypothetical protein
MMELKVNVPQIREFLNQIVEAPAKIFELLRVDVMQKVRKSSKKFSQK